MARGYGHEFNVKKVKRLMLEQGLNHEDMAFKCGIARSQLTRTLQLGRCREETLFNMAAALCVEIVDILPKYEEEPQVLKVKLDGNSKLPTRAHTYDAGLDLYAKINETYTIPPFGGSVDIDTGVHVQIPRHWCGLIKSKSGLMTNKKILTDGTVDADYTGSVHVTLFNHGDNSYTVEPGQKIAQLVIVPCLLADPVAVDSMEETERGDNGFGSTGKF